MFEPYGDDEDNGEVKPKENIAKCFMYPKLFVCSSCTTEMMMTKIIYMTIMMIKMIKSTLMKIKSFSCLFSCLL